ncbi:unnamed protein product [Protopolystoma xenopodis]|uniref:Uncharacterized protein n=1 Tax=Protopolystoma xenopodis TaxID=117903 RepID=A0A3S5CC07_9PLAT|nr:unnamed protein product [Protopolystoma xenopodis]
MTQPELSCIGESDWLTEISGDSSCLLGPLGGNNIIKQLADGFRRATHETRLEARSFDPLIGGYPGTWSAEDAGHVCEMPGELASQLTSEPTSAPLNRLEGLELMATPSPLSAPPSSPSPFSSAVSFDSRTGLEPGFQLMRSRAAPLQMVVSEVQTEIGCPNGGQDRTVMGAGFTNLGEQVSHFRLPSVTFSHRLHIWAKPPNYPSENWLPNCFSCSKLMKSDMAKPLCLPQKTLITAWAFCI